VFGVALAVQRLAPPSARPPSTEDRADGMSYAIFATPRTGSSWLAASYERRFPSLDDLDEYFCVNFLRSARIKNNDWYRYRARFPDSEAAYYLKTYESVGGSIRQHFAPLGRALCAAVDEAVEAARAPDELVWITAFEQPSVSILPVEAVKFLEARERLRRLEMLRAHADREHLLKVMPQDIDDKVIDYLNEAGFRVICLCRRKLLQQVLSFLVARHTQVMNLKAEDVGLRPRLRESQFVFREADLRILFPIDPSNIEESILAWHRMLPRFRKRQVVYYEDLAGSMSDDSFVKVLPDDDYLRFFENRDDVLRWYERFERKLRREHKVPTDTVRLDSAAIPA
jgi:hypothetical protein